MSASGSDAEIVKKTLIEAYREIHFNNLSNYSCGGIMKIDVAILTALPLELQAFLRHGGPWRRLESDRFPGRIYYHFRTQFGVSIIAACSLSIGQLSAALAARDLIDEWKPTVLILIGIAAGINKEVRLGDIVVSDQIVDYELGKVSPGGVTPRWSVYRSDPVLLSKLTDYRDASWIADIAVPRPDGQTGLIPRILRGVVLSGNKVIADKKTAGAIGSIWPHAHAIEMEGAGIAAAVHGSTMTTSFIMVKAICDYANKLKNDNWQPYAAEVAAAFTSSFILTALSRADVKLKEPDKMLETANTSVDLRAIRLAISSAFDQVELKMIMSDLEIDWDNIAGTTKNEKVIELIWHLKRHKRLEDLVHIIKKERKGLLESYEP
ncbi:MAG: 5'-methylthioadenosine/S-adenosylhomocysteine nucleosidase [Sedimentisphaerales bacterium]|nr:5'-methylthioadenosine/S-adenosylhomocysteine nucleosidase [Sedimentisphaerales bacterium]